MNRRAAAKSMIPKPMAKSRPTTMAKSMAKSASKSASKRVAESRPATRAGRLALALDQRLSLAKGAKSLIRKAFPDHWSFLLGEVALYSFLVLVLTGIWLTMFFRPEMSDVVYHGSYTPLDGTTMSRAYASVLAISFDVRSGLLIRQTHHWAALVFVSAVFVHMLRIFFSGAFRKPREINWLIGVTMLILSIAEGFAGYSLPDDLLSGTGLRTLDGIVLSIPVVGTYLAYFMFGRQFPGDAFIPRLFTVHILLIPGVLLALIGVHLLLVFYQKHTQWPQAGHTNSNVVGMPMLPVYAAKSGGLLFSLFGLLALFGGLVQINPIWLFGPYQPNLATSSSQPDWYMNFLEGGLRLMPNWQTTFAGHVIVWNVFVPGVGVPAALFTCLYLYPFAEAWITGEREERHLLDRPRDRPTRTALGAAGICFFAVLTFAGSDDVAVIAFRLDENGLVWLLRMLVLILPPVVFLLTRRLCMQLQRADRRAVLFGHDSGVVMEKSGGGYLVQTERLGPDERYRRTARDNGPGDPARRKGTGVRGWVSWVSRLMIVRWVRRHRVRKPTAAQYRLARDGMWTAEDEDTEP